MSYQVEFRIPLESLEKEEVLERINGKSNFVIVDTVGSYDGNKYKIKGALTIAYPDVVDRRGELIKYGEIIIYCKHSACVASKKVATALKILKVPDVKIYEGGIDEWTGSGLPVETID